MENIGQISGIWQFAALIVMMIIVPYFSKWLQSKEFKKTNEKTDNVNNKIDLVLKRLDKEELATKKNNLRCLILHFETIKTQSEQIKRKAMIDKLYLDYVNSGGNGIISALYDDFLEKYERGYYNSKKKELKTA